MSYLQTCHITLNHTEFQLINIYANKYNASNDSHKRLEEAYENYSAIHENTHQRRLKCHPRGSGQRKSYGKMTSTCTTTGKLNIYA
jgi:hypothetical protein